MLLAVGAASPPFAIERDRPGDVVTVGGCEMPFYLLPVRVATGPNGFVECVHVDTRGVVVLDSSHRVLTETRYGNVRYRWDGVRQREREEYRKRRDVSD